MAEISFEQLAFTFITVLLASLIGGFITVHFSARYQRSFRQNTPNDTSGRSRRSSHNMLANASTPPPLSSNAITTPHAQYTGNNIFQYPSQMQSQMQSQIQSQIQSQMQSSQSMSAMYNPQATGAMPHSLNLTPTNASHSHSMIIPPAPHHPPTASPPIKTAQKPAQSRNTSISDLFNDKYQPVSGNISTLRNRDREHVSPNNNRNRDPQHHESFVSSQKRIFTETQAKIMKFQPRTAMRVTEQTGINATDKNTTEQMKMQTESQMQHNEAIMDDQKMNFFNLPPIDCNNNDSETLRATDEVQMMQTQSFPDDILPSTLLSPQTPGTPSMDITSVTKKGRTRVIIACYKLPLKCIYNKESAEWEFEWEDIRNVLANLRGLHSTSPSEYDVVFVGWPGVTPNTIDEQEILEDALYSLRYQCYPIFLTESQIQNCYKIYCRSILWPLFHYLMPTNDFQFGNNYEKYWQSYVGLNNLYAKKACVAATDTDDDNAENDSSEIDPSFIIWFHDYHLLLAPHFVRRQIPLAQIGFFLHTIFPTSEVFRCLPTRKEILRGILSSDLVGFHTYDYARHFLSACKRILDLDFHTLPDHGTLAVHYLGRDVSLRIGHASILSREIHKTAQSPRVKQIRETFWKKKLNLGQKKIVLGLGELDEVRGTILTIQSFELFLSNHREWQNDIIFILCISSTSIAKLAKQNGTTNSHSLGHNMLRSSSYTNLRRPIDDAVNKMKHEFNNDVIQLIDSNNLSYNELLALYTLCDVALFGTFWDGFNTVPYEFTAAQPSLEDADDERGVPPAVILSEFMGCMRSLCGVFRINPWKISETASTLHSALCMTSAERRVAHHRRFTHVMKYTLIDWAQGFLNDLKKAAKSEQHKRVLPIGFGSNLRFIYIPNDLTNLKQTQKLLMNSFRRCKYKVLLLDYGGTLTDVDEMIAHNTDPNSKDMEKDNSYRDLLGITKDLQTISPKIIYNLQRISSDPNTIVAIISGQTRPNLEEAFKECPRLLICAEKGAYFKYPMSDKWVANEKLPPAEDMNIWQSIVHDVLKTYTERTNGSYIQRKSTALVWHYENADPHYGDMQAVEAERYLRRLIEKHHNLLVQRYDHCRALEVLPKEINKGSAALKVIDCMMKLIDYNEDDTTGNNIWFMAVGNDRSDEKMFEAVELVSKKINTEYGFTVRIGMAPTQARFYLTDHNQMMWLLNTLSSITKDDAAHDDISDIFQIKKPAPLAPTKSRSYSRGLSSLNSGSGSASGIGSNLPANNLTPIQAAIDADCLVSPEYPGSFFDNVAVRSHSYTSLSKLGKLAEFNQ